MSFCVLYSVVLENHSVHVSPCLELSMEPAVHSSRYDQALLFFFHLRYSINGELLA